MNLSRLPAPVLVQLLEEEKAKRQRLRPASVETPKGAIPFCPQTPKEKQQAFLDLTCEEALFGGSAGPGKSSALLMAALQYVDVPSYAALLLRRTYADLSLPGALMDRLGEWLRPTAARWNNTEKTWVFPSGATITFGYLETEVSKFRYQGAEFSLVCFDELSQFSESQYRYLFSRLRRMEGSTVPMRMRAATNPGAEWVKNRFEIDMSREELVQWTADGERAFIPARLSDNDSLDAVAYVRSLDKLDPITRRQLLEGDWDVRPEGALFKREWFQIVAEGPA
jgi:hypothetical protein